MGELRLKNLSIHYGGEWVIRNFDLEVRDGEMVSLLGPSGAGKTTILKAVAGLLPPVQGEIEIDGRTVHGLPPEKRDAVMVFQQPLLFPFMNVYQNIGFGLRMRGVGGAEVRRRIEAILELTQLEGMGHRKVHELSGGQQQRVSLARALILKQDSRGSSNGARAESAISRPRRRSRRRPPRSGPCRQARCWRGRRRLDGPGLTPSPGPR